MNEKIQDLKASGLAADRGLQKQVLSLCDRYYWAENYCRGKDVLEVACGSGAGLGYLASSAKTLTAGDISDASLEQARAHYGERFNLRNLDAQFLPYPDDSKDVIVLFEALCYLPSVDKFLQECRRVLRDGGVVLLATANKDCEGFEPISYSKRYYGVKELALLLEEHGFSTIFYGSSSEPASEDMTAIPVEIKEGMAEFGEPVPLNTEKPDRLHKIIFCEAQMRSEN